MNSVASTLSTPAFSGFHGFLVFLPMNHLLRFITSIRLPATLHGVARRLLAGALGTGVVLWHASALAQFGPSRNELSSRAPNAVVQTAQVRAELMAFAPEGIHPGAPLWLGLQLNHQPHWHTYWKNAGDSGLATRLEWELPAGLQAAEIAWPAPQRIPVGTLTNFGYEGRVLLPVPVQISDKFVAPPDGNVQIHLSASWLVCSQECIPQDGKFVLNIPAQGSMALQAGAFEQARNAAPVAHTGNAGLQVDASGLHLQVSQLDSQWRGKALNAFVESPDIVEGTQSPNTKDKVTSDQVGQDSAAQTGVQSWDKDGNWSAVFPLSSLRSESPSQLAFVLQSGDRSVRVSTTVNGHWPDKPDATHLSDAAKPATSTDTQSLSSSSGSGLPLSAGLLAVLFSALLGGLILNLMPCVFPVLAIKVLSFSKAHHEGAPGHRAEGIAYTAGVVLSFVALGALLLALRAGGEQLGWGFQLQSPAVICGLALLFTLIGMNLMDWLQIDRLLAQLPGTGLANLTLKHPLANAFLSGVLAVAIASPCTAPFMGASLGYAISLPSAQALAIFATLGLGLALPYLLASWFPSIERWMPRPGQWMETMRRFMAFPMWATVVWLLWILGHLSGVDGAFSLLALLLAVAWLVWALGLRGRAQHVFSAIALAVLVALGASLGGNIFQSPQDETSAASGSGHADASGGLQWEPWTAQKVSSAMAAHQPVFVDFTAAWCITCQYNERTTLSAPEVQADFRAHGVSLLRADWTRRDPAVTRALTELGRSGVPVYVLYLPDQPPRVMSEILTVSALRGALAQL